MAISPVSTIGKVLSGENLIPKIAVTELPKSMAGFNRTVDKFSKAQVAKPDKFIKQTCVNRGK